MPIRSRGERNAVNFLAMWRASSFVEQSRFLNSCTREIFFDLTRNRGPRAGGRDSRLGAGPGNDADAPGGALPAQGQPQ